MPARSRHALTALALCAATVLLLRLALPAASWAHLSSRRPAMPRYEESLVKPLPARPDEARPKSGGPPFPLACGDVDLVLDGFGGFGSASFGGDARFFDGAQRAATVFEAMAHLRNAGFLDGESMSLPQEASGALLDGDAVVASYVRGPFRFDVRSQLVQCDTPSAATLEQHFVVTHVGANPVALTLAHYLDGDLFFAGGFGNDFGVQTDDALYQFDEGSDPFAPSAFVELTSDAPLALRSTREVGEFPDQRRRLNRNLLLAGGLVRASGASADADGDGVTDDGFDVSLAIQHEFGILRPGDRVEMTTWIRWGVGRLGDLGESELTVDAGDDRVLECEGADGTAVPLHGSATDDSRIASWSWLVDGVPAAAGQDAIVDIFPGSHVVELQAIDDAGRLLSDEAALDVEDTTPPTVAAPPPVELWPPDHRLVPVSLNAQAADACSSAVEIVPLRVESSEPDDARRGGDGHTHGDAAIIRGVVYLRRERQGDGTDRLYRVFAEALDDAGNASPIQLDFIVPHDSRSRASRP